MTCFSQEEYADMLICYGYSSCSAVQARKEYIARYPGRRKPSEGVFITVYRRLRETGSVLQRNTDKGRPRIYDDEEEDETVQSFRRNQTTSINNVQVFDGLPQVLCKMCKTTLTSFQGVKEKFIKNQELLEGMHKKKVVDNKEVLKTETSDAADDDTTSPIIKRRKRKLRIESNSSESQSDKTNKETESSPWKLLYKKKFVCRFCAKKFSCHRTLKGHMETHETLIAAFNKKVGKHCVVQMDKIDLRPNLTGKTTNVVLYPSIIISDRGDPTYYSKFVPNEDVPLKQFCTKKADGEKRIQPVSRSSSKDTLVIDDDHIDNCKNSDNDHDPLQSLTNLDFVSIDDSTNESSNNDRENEVKTQSYKENDLKIVQDIISMCHSKYNTKFSLKTKSTKTPSDTALIRKFLSIGTKIMSKTGCVITSPGLLNYLYHENLQVKWLPNNSSSDHLNYVRIAAGVGTEKDEDDGWISTVVTVDHSQEQERTQPSVNAQQVMLQKYVPNSEVTLKLLQGENENSLKKLLNASPVNNPKQLPKKTLSIEVKPLKPKTVVNVDVDNGESILIDSDDDEMVNGSLPIITSTQSLSIGSASCNRENQVPNADQSSTKNDQESYPRIKCKPVSELMGSFINNSKHILVQPPVLEVPITEAPISQETGNDNCQLALNPILPNGFFQPVSSIITQPNYNDESITIDAMRPRTSTETNIKQSEGNLAEFVKTHPVKYFKKLLQERYLELVPKIKNDKKNIITLIKFKIDVHQDDKSVLISLALYVLNEKFCIRLLDPKVEDIESLPALWQTCILKSFLGQVSEKIANCAQKISPKLLANVFSFINALQCMDVGSVK